MSVFVSAKLQFKTLQDVDVAAVMRQGHPQIPEGDAYIIKLVKQHCTRLGRSLRVFDVGCGSGFFASKLANLIPEIELIANEVEPDIVTKLRLRLANSRAEVFSNPFEEWDEPVDMIISWGSHHHLPRTYLAHAKRVLRPDGVMILGDEFCPEYGNAAHRTRIASAEVIYIANGYVLTSAAEVAAYERDGNIPPMALELEQHRQQALWTWYRYVVDYAMERNCLAVAIDELRAAHDDLMTGFGDEHKMSPLIAERELELCGFRQLSKRSLGPSHSPEYQSFFVYEFGQ